MERIRQAPLQHLARAILPLLTLLLMVTSTTSAWSQDAESKSKTGSVEASSPNVEGKQLKECTTNPAKFWQCKDELAFSTGYLVPPLYVESCRECDELLVELEEVAEELKEERDECLLEVFQWREREKQIATRSPPIFPPSNVPALFNNNAKTPSVWMYIGVGAGGVLTGLVAGLALGL